jgi:hypothetical protein
VAIKLPVDPTTHVAATQGDAIDLAPATTPVVSAPTHSTTDPADPTEVVEERWSLVPTGIALSQETSFSLVPTLTQESAEVESSEAEPAQQ